MKTIFKFSSSLKLAVIVIVLLSTALAAGTIVESLYDLPTAWFWVYRTWWFYLILGLLGVNIVAVALSRWPWKRRHTPFLLAHLGIIMILVGSWVTQQWGLDGSLVVSEGQASPFVELEDRLLTIRRLSEAATYNIPWLPPNATFRPYPAGDVRIVNYLSHADSVFEFGRSDQDDKRNAFALQIRLKGGPLPQARDFWLWLGDPQWSFLPLGPAKILFHPKGGEWFPEVYDGNEMGRVEFRLKSEKEIEYLARTRSGKKKSGLLHLKDGTQPSFETGWMGLSITVLKWEPRAVNLSTYAPSRKQYGDQSPPSAIEVEAGGIRTWLGEGDQTVLNTPGTPLELSYYRKRVMLPFRVELKKFSIDYYEGSMSPRSYASDVEIFGGDPSVAGPMYKAKVSMNEPLDWGGYTFYQSSYVPGEPRPTTSIFSVNRDPGRGLKYWGSVLLVFGSVLLFAVKYAKAGRIKKWMT